MTSRKPAYVTSLVIGVATSLALAVACADGAVEKTVSAMLPTAPSMKARSDQSAAPGRTAQEEFHAKNHMDWVGQEHNRALAEFSIIMNRGSDRKDLCKLMLKYMVEFRLKKGDAGGSAQDREDAAITGARKTGVCGSRFGSDKQGSGMLASMRRSTSVFDEPSPEAQNLMN